MLATLRRLNASLLVICIAVPLPSQAAMLATDASLAAAQRDQVTRVLERADFQARLAALGVDAAAVKSRVAALTDDEVAQLAAKIDNLPAGGDGIHSEIVVIILILPHTVIP